MPRYEYSDDDALMHYGVLGMKWGVRKDGKPQGYQGKGGTRKAKRANKKAVKANERMTRAIRGNDRKPLTKSEKRARTYKAVNTAVQVAGTAVVAYAGYRALKDAGVDFKSISNTLGVGGKSFTEAAIKSGGKTKISDLPKPASIPNSPGSKWLNNAPVQDAFRAAGLNAYGAREMGSTKAFTATPGAAASARSEDLASIFKKAGLNAQGAREMGATKAFTAAKGAASTAKSAASTVKSAASKVSVPDNVRVMEQKVPGISKAYQNLAQGTPAARDAYAEMLKKYYSGTFKLG